MAGIYDTAYQYSVLTMAANDSVSGFHDRMPVLLSGVDLEPWLLDHAAFPALMEKKMPMLEHRQDNEQKGGKGQYHSFRHESRDGGDIYNFS